MIRPAIHSDVPVMVDLGRALCAESPRWCRLQFNGEKLAALLVNLIDSRDGFAWVAVASGAVVGALIAILDEHWASNDLVAQELSLFVRQDARGAIYAARLITVLDAWAEQRGAKWLQAGASTGVAIDRTAQLYERLGFERCAIGLERFYGN
jgi:GNAT superfamily N-acetyltransferase